MITHVVSLSVRGSGCGGSESHSRDHQCESLRRQFPGAWRSVISLHNSLRRSIWKGKSLSIGRIEDAAGVTISESASLFDIAASRQVHELLRCGNSMA